MFNVKHSTLRTIKQNDPKWLLRDEYVVAPRAGFEIDQHCPERYKDIIVTCIERGWLKPVANIKDRELIWEELER